MNDYFVYCPGFNFLVEYSNIHVLITQGEQQTSGSVGWGFTLCKYMPPQVDTTNACFPRHERF